MSLLHDPLRLLPTENDNCRAGLPALRCCTRNGANGPVRKQLGSPQPFEAQNRDLAMGPVGIGIVVETCFVGPFDGGRNADERTSKAPHCSGLRHVMATQRDPDANAIRRQLRQTQADIVQFDPVSGLPRGLHLVESAEARQGGLRRGGECRTDYRLHCCTAARAVRVRVEVPHPFCPPTTTSVDMPGCFAPAGQPIGIGDSRMTRSLRRVREMYAPSRRTP